MGMFGFVTIMDLSITVLCAENFEGPDCTECVPGFIGTDCQVDDCIGVNCSGNGVCVLYVRMATTLSSVTVVQATMDQSVR